MKKIYIFSARVAKDLIKNFFIVVDISENMNDKGKTVFCFEDTKVIRNYLKRKHDIVIS